MVKLLQQHSQYRLLTKDQRTQASILANRPLLTQGRLRSDQAKDTGNRAQKGLGSRIRSPQDPEIPAFSLKDLGANRATKTVVVIALSVLATMESIFWIKVGWRRFGPSTEHKVSADAKEG